jgi:hypothetical protein
VMGAVSLLPIMTRAEYREWLLGWVEVVGRDSMCVIWSKLINREHLCSKGKERLWVSRTSPKHEQFSSLEKVEFPDIPMIYNLVNPKPQITKPCNTIDQIACKWHSLNQILSPIMCVVVEQPMQSFGNVGATQVLNLSLKWWQSKELLLPLSVHWNIE